MCLSFWTRENDTEPQGQTLETPSRGMGLGNARRWFAVKKAQGPELALGAAASVRLAGFWLALACGRSRSCPLMVARADARSAGHGRTTHSTKLVEGERAAKSAIPPQNEGCCTAMQKKAKKRKKMAPPLTELIPLESWRIGDVCYILI